MMVIWGLWMDGTFCSAPAQRSRKGRNLAKNPRCVIGTENAHEAVIVEGVVEINNDPQAAPEIRPAIPEEIQVGYVDFRRSRLCASSSPGLRTLREGVHDQATRWQFADPFTDHLRLVTSLTARGVRLRSRLTSAETRAPIACLPRPARTKPMAIKNSTTGTTVRDYSDRPNSKTPPT